MNTRTRLILGSLLTTLLLASGGARADSYPPYYHDLLRHGTWFTLSDAWVWQPPVVRTVPGWRPYLTAGNWQREDGNWFWTSDYDWGAITFHHGRWYDAPGRGWVWVPGTDWAPAWVTWRVTDDLCGWAPLPPEGDFFARLADDGGKTAFELSWSHFCFVPRQRFLARSLDGYALDASTHGRTAREVAYGPEPASVGLVVRFGGGDLDVRAGYSSPRVYRPSTVCVEPPPVAFVPPAINLPLPPFLFPPPVIRWPTSGRREGSGHRGGPDLKDYEGKPDFRGYEGKPDFRGYEGKPDDRGGPDYKGGPDRRGGPEYKGGADYKGGHGGKGPPDDGPRGEGKDGDHK